jgi:hypothetical protein
LAGPNDSAACVWRAANENGAHTYVARALAPLLGAIALQIKKARLSQNSSFFLNKKKEKKIPK